MTTRTRSGIDRTLLLATLLAAVLLPGCGADRAPDRSAAAPAAHPSTVTPAPASTPPPATATTALPAGTAAADAPGAVYTARAGVEPGRPTSLRDAYPDYRPGANDPEIESTRTGRRTVAVHERTFEAGGAASLADLARDVVSGIDRGDAAALDRAAITFGDFRDILWPEMPQSRPAANVPAGEAWDFLRRRHLSAFNRTAGDVAGTGLQVFSIEVGKVVEYTNFRLHDDLRVTVVDARGDVIHFPVIRTVAECRGRFKLYSTRD